MTPETNPYRPPMSDIIGLQSRSTADAASRWRRVGTIVVDYIGLLVVGALIGALIGLFFGDAGIAALQSMPDLALGCVVLLLYYTIFEGVWARTPGKLLFGTVVIDENGGKPSIARVVGRTFCRMIPFEVFSFFGERGWHDKIPKTRVVLAKTR